MRFKEMELNYPFHIKFHEILRYFDEYCKDGTFLTPIISSDPITVVGLRF